MGLRNGLRYLLVAFLGIGEKHYIIGIFLYVFLVHKIEVQREFQVGVIFENWDIECCLLM